MENVMFQTNEIVMFVISFAIIISIILNYDQISKLPSAKMLLSSFYMFSLASILTILEDFLLTDTLNLLEHLSYAISSILFAVWCKRVFQTKRNI